jgi:hypothetical protein
LIGYTISFIYSRFLSFTNGGVFLQSLDIALAIGVSGFSAIMMATSVYSYSKTKVSKLLPLCLAFLLFMIKGLYFVYEVIIEYSLSTSVRIVLILDFIIIILIYLAVAKK